MYPGSARRALLNFLQYAVGAGAAAAQSSGSSSTLRIFCFAGCALCDLRLLLAPFGLSLRADGVGGGVTPAGHVFCQISGVGGPRPVLTLWKVAAVEGVVLGGVLTDKASLLGMLPVTVFREVLWPWVKTAVVCKEAKHVEHMQWLEDVDVDMSVSSDDSDTDDSASVEADDWDEDLSDLEHAEEAEEH